ncbi:MAG: ATP-binding protein [Bacteroidota bacterium]
MMWRLFWLAILIVGQQSEALAKPLSIPDSTIIQNFSDYDDSTVHLAIIHTVNDAFRLERADRGIEILDRGIAYFKSQQSHNYTGRILHKKATMLTDQDDRILAQQSIAEAQRIFTNLQDTLWMGKCLNTLGLLAWQDSDYSSAMGHYDKAVKFFDKVGAESSRWVTVSNIGILHYEIGNSEKALEYFAEYLAYIESKQDKAEMMRMYGNIAVIHKSLNHFELAQEYFEKSIKLGRERRDIPGLISAYHNLAGLFLKTDKLDQAQLMEEAAIRLTNSSTSAKRKSILYGRMGDIAASRNDFPEALEYYQRNLDLAKEASDLFHMSNAHYSLYELYKKESMHKEALYHHEEMIDINDTLRRINEQGEINLLTIQFDAKKKELDFERQKADLLEKDQELSQLYVFCLALTILAMGLVIWHLSYRNRRIKSEKYRLEQENLFVQKQNRRLEAYNYQMEQFAYILSHNLKEPLRSIGSFSSLLERRFSSRLDEDGHQYLGFIRDGVVKLKSLMGEMQNFIDTRQIDQQAAWINPNELMEEILEPFEPEMKSKSIHLELDRLPSVFINPAQLKQVLNALIDNAIKYVSASRGQISIFGDETETEAIIIVRDNGCGIDPQNQQDIFGLFRQVSPQGSEKSRGVGLALCKKIIEEQYGGQIWLDSALGQGSSFYVSLPK